MKELEDFLILLGQNFARQSRNSVNFAQTNIPDDVANYVRNMLPKNSSEILKKAGKEKNDVYLAEVICLLYKLMYMKTWMGGLTLDLIKEYEEEPSIESSYPPTDEKFFGQWNMEQFAGDFNKLPRFKSVPDYYEYLAKTPATFIVSVSGDAETYNPVLIWGQGSSACIFIPSKRVYENVKFLLTEEQQKETEQSLGNLYDGYTSFDKQKLITEKTNTNLGFFVCRPRPVDHAKALVSEVEKILHPEKEPPKHWMRVQEEKRKLDRNLKRRDDSDKEDFLTVDSFDNADDYYPVDLEDIEPFLRKQSGEKDCLLASTEIINKYLEQYNEDNLDGAVKPLPEGGNTSMAHCVIDEYGKEVGKKTSTFVKVDKNRAKLAFDYINDCLDREIPVLVGLNYKRGKYKNNDGVTDHFSLIVGRDFNDKDEFEFLMYDVADGQIVPLLVHKNFLIDSYAALKNDKRPRRYQLTQVRVYYSDDFEDITGERKTIASSLPKPKDTAVA